MAFEIPENTAWVSFDAESVQDIFGYHDMNISDEEAQEILDSLRESICSAMSNAGFAIIESEYWKRSNG